MTASTEIGLYGKLPSHGDFLRRGLPHGFAQGWHDWLEAGLRHAEDALGAAELDAAWDGLGAWCFALPAAPVAGRAAYGALAGARDAVGRRFPLALLLVLPSGATPPAEPWFSAAAKLAEAGRAGGLGPDALADVLASVPRGEAERADAAGWWRGEAAIAVPRDGGCPLPALLHAAQREREAR